MDLAIEVPGSPLEAVMSNEVWSEVYNRIADLIEAHRTTIVFVNTRRLAERVTHNLAERLGKDKVTSHHGSLSAKLRLEAEDRLIIPEKPLDVLAQQIVAAAATEDWDEQQLFDLMRSAYPYRNLAREEFDDVVRMLSEGFSTKRGRRAALLHHDAINHRLRGRRGARLTALTSGGAIPDNADYRVVLEPSETFVGTVNEDFAVE